MRGLAFLVFLSIFFVKAFAQSVYFDFNPKSHFIDGGSEFEVEFKYKFEGYEEKDFLVSPLVDRGLVSYKSGVLSSTYPLSIIGFGKTNLSFDVWNIKTGKVYKTPIRSVWGTSVYSNYIEKLNANLKSFVDDKINR